MQKEEIIFLHQFLSDLLNCIDEEKKEGIPYVQEYIDSGIKPSHIHKPKSEHLYAVFLLAAGISHLLSQSTDAMPRTMPRKLDKIAKKWKTKTKKRGKKS